MFLEFKVINDAYSSLKEVLKVEFNISERLILKLKTNKKIYINNKVSYINSKINLNDIIKIDLNFKEDNSNIIPTKMNLDIIYEDECYLIINKPSGIPVHPSILHYTDSLSNGVRYYFDTINLSKKTRSVNRLDKDTSGLVIFAKNEYIQECLINQMKNKCFTKKYIALLNGILENKSGTINEPIARKQNSIIERCVDNNGDPSITHYKVLDEFSDLSLVEFNLETGRTHQIRVHSSFIGHPILGDSLYGEPSSFILRQALHAYYLSFIHPINKQQVIYTAPLPDDIKNILERYNK